MCQEEITLFHHISTRHAEEKSNESEIDYDDIRENNDFFQIEIVKNEAVYSCNLCDEGFDTMDEIKKHISDMHKEIISDIFNEQREENDLNENAETKIVCNEKICLDKGNGMCGNICKYLD